MFRLLDSSEEPSLCLFFVHDPKTMRQQLTPGIASLVTQDGLAVTMSHVVLAGELKPGDKIWLVHIATRVALQADVLETCWMGPRWEPWRHHQIIPPEEWREDIAFLRIDPATSTALTRSRAPESSAREEFCDRARVLPLGVPGYNYDSRTPLGAWRVDRMVWDGSNTLAAFDSARGTAYFESADRALYDTVQLRSDTIAEGFSGSPLWDARRRVAVGFVRRAVPIRDRFQATDARALTCHPSVWMTLDSAAKQLCEEIHELGIAARRRFYLLEVSDEEWIEPQVRELHFDPQRSEFSGDDNKSMPALGAVEKTMRPSRLAVLLGGAGSGKTRLLVQLANTSPRSERLPVFVSAHDLIATGDVSFAERIERAVRSIGASWPKDTTLTEILKLNDLKLDVFIDGLDELARGQRLRLIEHLRRFLSLGTELPIASIVVASRPIDELYDSELLPQAVVLELLPLEFESVKALIEKRFPLPEEAQMFRDTLATNRLLHDGGNPLQLTLAATIFGKLKSLPKPSELVSTFIAVELDRMRDEARKTADGWRNREAKFDASYYDAARDILSLMGLLTLRTANAVTMESLPDEIGALLENKCPAWLDDKNELLSFIDQQLSGRGGLVDTRELTLKWMHQSIADQCAADAVLKLANRDVLEWALQQVADSARHGFVLNLLSTMSANGKDVAVDTFVREIASRISVQPRAILIPLHLLASDVPLAEPTTRRVIQQFCRVVLADQLRQTCAELMTLRPSDLMDLAALCRHPNIRPLMIAAIEERLRVRRQTEFSRARLTRSGKAAAPAGSVVLTEREDEVLRKLDLKNEIRIPMVTPRQPGPIGPTQPWMSPLNGDSNGRVSGVMHLGRNGDDTIVSASAPEFAKALISFARDAGNHLRPEDVLLMYLRFMLQSAPEQNA